MSAEVMPVQCYQAYCDECNWFGEAYFTSLAASDEAHEHNTQHHQEDS